LTVQVDRVHEILNSLLVRSEGIRFLGVPFGSKSIVQSFLGRSMNMESKMGMVRIEALIEISVHPVATDQRNLSAFIVGSVI